MEINDEINRKQMWKGIRKKQGNKCGINRQVNREKNEVVEIDWKINKQGNRKRN